MTDLQNDTLPSRNLGYLWGHDSSGKGGKQTPASLMGRAVILSSLPGIDRTGATDSTAAFQAALNAMSDGDVLILDAGTYLVDNLTLPAKLNARIQGRGKPTIKKRSGGSSDYLLASYNYLNNVANAQPPFDIIDVKLDGNGIAQNGIIWQSWDSRFEGLDITGMTRHGIHVTALTANATQISGTLVNNRLRGCLLRDNGGDGIHTTDPNRNQVTDMMIDGCFVYGNDGWGVYFAGSAGLIMRGCHLYGNTSGDAYYTAVGFGTIIALNHFEGVVDVGLPVDGICHIGPGNDFRAQLKCSFNSSGAKLVIVSVANRYYGSNGYILHNYFDPTRIVYSISDHFETNQPYRWHNGSSTGVFVAKSSYSFGLDSALDGPATVGRTLPKDTAILSAAPSGSAILGDIARNRSAHMYEAAQYVYDNTTASWLVESYLQPSWRVPVRKVVTLAAGQTSTSVTFTFAVSAAKSGYHGKLSVDVSMGVLSNSFNTMDTLSGRVDFIAARKFNSGVNAVAASVNAATATANVSFGTPTVSSDGSSGVQTITCTIVINHPVPSGTDSQVVCTGILDGNGVSGLA